MLSYLKKNPFYFKLGYIYLKNLMFKNHILKHFKKDISVKY